MEELKAAKGGGGRRRAATAVFALLLLSSVLAAQDTSAVRFVNDSVSVRFVETDIRAVIQAIGRYLPKPVLIGPIQPVRVTLETPGPVDRATLRSLLRGLLESQNLEFVEDSAFYRVGPRQQPEQRPGRALTADSGPVQLFVIRLRHARASDVAATVNQLFGGTGAFSGQGGGFSTGTLSDELRRNVVPPAGAAAQPGQLPVRQSSLAGSVTIVPDELTNSLLVRASQVDFDVIKEAVEQLDIRPLQVLIEVLIVEARHDRSFSLGADLFVPPQKVDNGDGTAGGQVTGGGLGDLVITLMNLGRANIDATIRAAASRGEVEIISRPVLLASNNQEARFLVGSQRPFVQVSRSLPTDSPQRDQVIQYRDVGTKLTVRPTINQDGYVSLLIQQEINQATSEVQFDAPVISTREAVTQVLVRNGQTIVIGGLRDQQKDVTRGGVPVLSGIPLLGGLFGRSDRKSNQTELYLFLTPRILATDADADSVTVPRLQRSGQQ
jgi:general secretion pathway protein D